MKQHFNLPKARCAISTLLLALSVASVHAGSRSSANYSILTDTNDSGGKRASSATYTNDSSAGGIAGISTVAAPAESTKSGYIGQLYEATNSLVLNAAPLTINEGGTLQLAAFQLLDDSTFLTVPATSVTWSVVSGPLTSINANGLATAGIVYQNTAASAQGIYAGNTSPPLALTVLNVNIDDLPGYSGDGIGDDWQVQYFGLPPNPAAGPLLDPDGDGQNNRFEWIAGLIPTDATSAFKLSIVRNAGNAILRFGQTVAGRTYTVKYGFDFLDVPNWPALPGGIITGVANELFVTDPNAITLGPKRYYRVEIAKP